VGCPESDNTLGTESVTKNDRINGRIHLVDGLLQGLSEPRRVGMKAEIEDTVTHLRGQQGQHLFDNGSARDY
jgi:hypothetical protein